MYDIIGSKEKAVAIIEKGGKKLAEQIMRKHKNVKSVLKKISGRSGEFRLYKLRLILGDKNTEVFHREHGMIFKLDPRKVYFSPREATERQRIAELVKPKEKILVMFAGIAPFAIAIAKEKVCEITCVEINPDACKYAEENITRNKLKGSVEIICGDIRKVWKKLEKFDRILMPLPESAWKFLKYAFRLARKGTIIHLYGISEEKNLFKDLEAKIAKEAEKEGVRVKIITRQKVLPFAPRKWKVRIDLKVK
jgi:tRNA (guanine37-N1)-methyltransferase